jgi:hypothetical protein
LALDAAPLSITGTFGRIGWLAGTLAGGKLASIGR